MGTDCKRIVSSLDQKAPFHYVVLDAEDDIMLALQRIRLQSRTGQLDPKPDIAKAQVGPIGSAQSASGEAQK